MHLLSAPLAGFAACPNGWVELYIRGSSTRATWYADFEGHGSNSTGANVTLDAYGAAEIYVNQLVDVVVKQSDGTLYREYTDGYASPNVEVISDAFTGTNYDTALTQPGEPTTLQAVLDKWNESSGATDWQIVIRGATRNLSTLAGTVDKLVINVQSPEFGAVGDGTTDDTTAILNALAAAIIALSGNVGVTVFFPKGIYRTTTVITWDYRVNILMVPGSSIAIDHATSNTLKFTSANATGSDTWFIGVGFKALQTNTGNALSLEASQRLRLVGCRFGMSALSTGNDISVSSAQELLNIDRCRFSLNGTAQSALAMTANVTLLDIVATEFTVPAAYAAVAVTGATNTGAVKVRDCSFIGTAATGRPLRPGTGVVSVTRTAYTGTWADAMFLDGSGPLYMAGNHYGATFTDRFGGITTTLDSKSYVELDKYEAISGAQTTWTLSKHVEFHQYRSTGTAPTITFPNGIHRGQLKRTLFRNESGGNWVAVVPAGATTVAVTSLGPIAVTAGSMVMCSWIWTPYNGTDAWVYYDMH